MASKPETVFISNVHGKLHTAVYAEKMHNPYRGGTFDVYYEALKDIAWIEYKFIEKLPPTIELWNTKKKPCLSSLQQDWFFRAVNNKKKAFVVLGWGKNRDKRGIILDYTTSQKQLARVWLQAHGITTQQIADEIFKMVLY